MAQDTVVGLAGWHKGWPALYYIYHPVDGNRIRVKMNYDYKVAGAEDLISVLVRGIEEGTCGNH